jgi:hypothetical protein
MCSSLSGYSVGGQKVPRGKFKGGSEQRSVSRIWSVLASQWVKEIVGRLVEA